MRLLCRAGWHRWRPASEQEITDHGGYVLFAERCTRCPAWNRPPPYLAAAIRGGGYRGGQAAETMGPPPPDVPSVALPPARPASMMQPVTFGDSDMTELRRVRLEPVSEDEDRW